MEARIAIPAKAIKQLRKLPAGTRREVRKILVAEVLIRNEATYQE
jgi:mRNA-degrading endonuclease RelE of RelBE toxin-antitoxin system